MLLTEGDNELLINTSNRWSLEEALTSLKTKKFLLLKEWLAPYEEYSNEIVLPIINKKGVLNLPTPIIFHNYSTEGIIRTFDPKDSGWIFIKLYTSQHNINGILTKCLSSLTESLEFCQMTEKWFYLRYADSDSHMRLRILPKTDESRKVLIELLNKWIQSIKLDYSIYRVIFDTYEREIERYGGTLILECESLFYASSKSILSLYAQGLEFNIDTFGFLTTYILAKNTFGEIGAIEFIKEVSNTNIKTIGSWQPRSDWNKQALETFDSARKTVLDEIVEDNIRLNETISRFDLETSPILSFINAECKNNEVLKDILRSLIHVHINRLYKENQNTKEILIYVALERTFEQKKWKKLIRKQ
jgi:thiopeptide-type bacteriocin biosynthesis protein